MSCNWWVIILEHLVSWLHEFELDNLFRFCPLHFLKTLGSESVSYQDPSVYGLILARVWVMFQVHKCCFLSIIKSRQRRRLFPCCSEPTHVYIPVWSRAYTVCIFLTMERLFVWGVQMVISRGWDRIWLSFEDTSGRSIDGEADKCLISHPPGWISSWIADRLVVELLVQKTYKRQGRRDQGRNRLA